MQLNYSDARNHTNTTSSIEEPCTNIDIVLNAYYVPFIYGTAFILGSTLNTAAIIVYLFAMKEWNRSNIFLFNLLVADLLYIFNLPFLVSVYSNYGIWYYGALYCKIMKFLYHANLYTSILFLSCVSMDRYLLIAHPVKSAQLFKKWHAVLISILIWVVVTLELVPMFYLITVEGVSNSTELKCLDYASSGDVINTFIFSMTMTFTGFLFPFSILVYSYVLVARVLKDMQLRLKKNSQKAGKPLTLIVYAMVLFSGSFFPYHVMRNARILTRMYYEPTSCPLIICRVIYNITRPLSSLNSCLNPVFYFLVGDSFRDKLLLIFKRKPKNKRIESIASVSTTGEPI